MRTRFRAGADDEPDRDVDATTRIIDQQKDRVVLVGHSYAGSVITEAGNNAKVSALVYVEAAAQR